VVAIYTLAHISLAMYGTTFKVTNHVKEEGRDSTSKLVQKEVAKKAGKRKEPKKIKAKKEVSLGDKAEKPLAG
jgi:hypothetical protein